MYVPHHLEASRCVCVCVILSIWASVVMTLGVFLGVTVKSASEEGRSHRSVRRFLCVVAISFLRLPFAVFVPLFYSAKDSAIPYPLVDLEVESIAMHAIRALGVLSNKQSQFV